MHIVSIVFYVKEAGHIHTCWIPFERDLYAHVPTTELF